MSAIILDFCDTLENSIREFIAANPDGGRFCLPEISRANALSIPVMIGVFDQEGFRFEYDCDVETDQEWFDITKKAVLQLSAAGYDDDAYPAAGEEDAYADFDRFSD